MLSLLNLFSFDLSIPVWQVMVFIGLMSLFMIFHRVAFCFTTTYVFALYWIFYLFGPHFLSRAGDTPLAMTAYILLGLTLAGLTIFSFFFYEE